MRHTKLRRTSWAVAAAIAVVIAGTAWLRAPGGAAEKAAESDGQPAIAAGARLFHDQACIQCHYPDSAEEKIGPGLERVLRRETLPASGRPATRENVRSQLVDPYGSMPSFEGRLTESETEHLLDYLETL